MRVELTKNNIMNQFEEEEINYDLEKQNREKMKRRR